VNILIHSVTMWMTTTPFSGHATNDFADAGIINRTLGVDNVIISTVKMLKIPWAQWKSTIDKLLQTNTEIKRRLYIYNIRLFNIVLYHGLRF